MQVKSNIKIMYITKLKDSMANGVTVAVTQLLNSICKYANIGWLDLGNSQFDVNPDIIRFNKNNWKDFNADIVVFEDPFNTVEFCRIAKQLRKDNIPYVISPHGCFEKVALQKKALKKYIAIKILYRRYLNGCYATQYLCDSECNNSMQFNEHIVIPNGIPDNEAYKVKHSVNNIVFIGRKDVRHKGIDYLLEAVCKIKLPLKKRGVHIALYGSIESEADEGFIDGYIKEHNLGSLVSNNGPVFGIQKERVLLDADMFILTSRHEGFPMSILEALSYGLPVLITNGTNMDGIVKDAGAGWTCRTDVDEIAATLLNTLDCFDCSDISRNARKLSIEYSWDKVSQMTVDKYSEIIKKKRG